VPDRDEIEGLVVGGEIQRSLNLIVVEGSDRNRSQFQGHCLQEDVLRRVASFQLDVPLSPVSVLGLRALIHSCDDEDDRRLLEGSLLQPRLPKKAATIIFANDLKGVLTREIVVCTLGGSHIQL
jgi:hypothetical protein